MLLMATVALAGCQKASEPVTTPTPLAVEAVAVGTAGGEGADDAASAVPATISYDRESVLSFRVGGTLTQFNAHLGDRLARGALVAAIDATAYRAAATRAEAEAARLERTTRRNAELLAAGAIASADAQDEQSALTAARAAATNARYDLRASQIHMPFPGIVLAKSVELGATLAPGQPLVTVADARTPLIARAQVAPSIAHRLSRGMAAQVQAADRSTLLNGHIQRISAASDLRTGSVEVDVALDGRANVASGTTASVRFAGGGARGAGLTTAQQIIPADALVDNVNGTGHVFIVDPRAKVARLVVVRVLGADGENVRVNGLPSDARVITAGAGFVVDGQSIAVQAQ